MSAHADPAATERLIGKVRALPPEKIAKVEDVVDFLRERLAERGLVRGMSAKSERAFAAVWDNPDDAAYDEL